MKKITVKNTVPLYDLSPLEFVLWLTLFFNEHAKYVSSEPSMQCFQPSHTSATGIHTPLEMHWYLLLVNDADSQHRDSSEPSAQCLVPSHTQFLSEK